MYKQFGLFKKILNVLLCVLMVVTVFSVNTNRISADDGNYQDNETVKTDNESAFEDDSSDNEKDSEVIEQKNIEEETTDSSDAFDGETEENNIEQEEVKVEPVVQEILGTRADIDTDFSENEYIGFQKVTSVDQLTEDVPIIIVASQKYYDKNAEQYVYNSYVYNGSGKGENGDEIFWPDEKYGDTSYKYIDAVRAGDWIADYTDYLDYDTYSKYAITLANNPYYTGEADLPSGISKENVAPYLLVQTYGSEKYYLGPNFFSTNPDNRKSDLYLYSAADKYSFVTDTRVPYGFNISFSDTDGALVTDNMNRAETDNGTYDDGKEYPARSPLSDLRFNITENYSYYDSNLKKTYMNIYQHSVSMTEVTIILSRQK